MNGVVLVLASIAFTSHSYEDREENQLARLVLALNPTVARRGSRLVTPPRVQLPQMKVDMKDVKQLKDATGVGLMDCKSALEAAGGDIEEATAELRKKGLAKAEKRSGRATGNGAIVPYIHGDNLGVLIEVACETDFVSKNTDFKEFGKYMAMHVVAYPDVEAVDEDALDPAFVAKEREIAMASEDLNGKPEEIKAKMVEGRIAKILKTKLLLNQETIKGEGMTVGEYVKSMTVKFGENIKIVRFTKYTVGESN